MFLQAPPPPAPTAATDTGTVIFRVALCPTAKIHAVCFHCEPLYTVCLLWGHRHYLFGIQTSKNYNLKAFLSTNDSTLAHF